ncbi:MAG: erythronate-4-phosphate dehydrogenase [Glaciecola sp.]
MNILYDAAMPYAEAFFSEFGNAKAFEVGGLTPNTLIDIDALFVRSTTKVDAELLKQANRLQFVATATAGFNHLDTAYLDSQNIKWYAAGGCNAVAVAEYVLSAIFQLALEDGFDPIEKKVAIIGAGNVGSALSKILEAFSIDFILCDPPLEAKGDERTFGHFDEAMQADIICLHTPLVKGGEFPSYHMFSKNEFESLKQTQYLINACRGEVVDNSALLASFIQGKKLNVVLDVWENEPLINHQLIPYTRLATAHIAGHTLEGKARGTSMVYDAFCRHLNKQIVSKLEQFLPDFKNKLLVNSSSPSFHQFFHIVTSIYDIKKDDGIFRSRMAKSEAFAEIRKHYPVRRESSAVTLEFSAKEDSENYNKNVAKIAASIGFKIAN